MKIRKKQETLNATYPIQNNPVDMKRSATKCNEYTIEGGTRRIAKYLIKLKYFLE